jgi:hypothetical protein
VTTTRPVSITATFLRANPEWTVEDTALNAVAGAFFYGEGVQLLNYRDGRLGQVSEATREFWSGREHLTTLGSRERTTT